MGSPPLVSVIMIFLDTERFIDEAIASVYAQTYSRWELILVDDGSTDGSTAIARGHAERDPTRVRYFEHEAHANRGMSVSRNVGIRDARGEYIALLDADDIWLRDKLDRQVRLLEAHPVAALAYGKTTYWWSWADGDAERDVVLSLGVEAERVVQPPKLLRLALESRAPTPCPSDMLVRRAAVELVGGFDETFPNLFEDQAFLAKIYVRFPVYVSGESWFLYRQHEDSCVSVGDAAGRKHEAGLVYFDWLERYLGEHSIRDRALLRALRRKRRRYRHASLRRLKALELRARDRLRATLDAS